MRSSAQVTEVVTHKLLDIMQQQRGGLLGEGHSWTDESAAAAQAQETGRFFRKCVSAKKTKIAPNAGCYCLCWSVWNAARAGRSGAGRAGMHHIQIFFQIHILSISQLMNPELTFHHSSKKPGGLPIQECAAGMQCCRFTHPGLCRSWHWCGAMWALMWRPTCRWQGRASTPWPQWSCARSCRSLFCCCGYPKSRTSFRAQNVPVPTIRGSERGTLSPESVSSFISMAGRPDVEQMTPNF